MIVSTDRLGLTLFDDAYLQQPYPLYEQMLATAPVHPIGDSGFSAVCGWDAVSEAVERLDDFSSNLTATMLRRPDGTVGAFEMDGLGGPTQVLATADDPAHAAHRKMLVPRLAAKRIHAVEPLIAQTMDRLWHEGRHDGGIEWMSAVANRLPMMIVARLIGVPDEDVDQLVRWAYAGTQLLEGLGDAEGLAAAGVAVMELAGYISDHFGRAAIDPGDNLLGDVATACATAALDTVTAQVMMITLFSAGGESTASLIGSAAWILATHPDIQRRVRACPELLGPFLEEVLRCEPPFRGHYRHVRRDTTLAGVPLRSGERLLLLWSAANRDPSRFSEPNEFRLDRTGLGHLAFGRGAHFCVGATLARMEARIVIGELLARTSDIGLDQAGRWLPSLLVRRLEHLKLTVA
ncbi:cytochrome [Mycolicibacter minnesotensis]|uniref:Cytochrome n=1 Tax=Mycolicibacter minnesotensis TaxID=1118379 RepID=A0A7I7R7M0_9MYCO|nr:cytochrome P450 [Mycolicibacter minnesotensis]ORA99166.1 cytochrome [Mycolicibacter minnesotensis]BBY34678.1 cytochrome P450 [Mycolicibacter minnesotensis]